MRSQPTILGFAVARRKQVVAGRAGTFVAARGVGTELITIAPFRTLVQVDASALILRVHRHPLLAETHAAVERCPARVLARQ